MSAPVLNGPFVLPMFRQNITCYRQIPRFFKSSQSLKPRCLLGVRKRG